MVHARFRLDRTTIRQLWSYGWATGLSAGITLGGPIVLHELVGLPEEAAVGLALAAAFVTNFLTIRTLVFRSQGEVVGELKRFIVVSVAFRIGEYVLFLILHNIVGIFYVYSVFTVLVLSFFIKFISHRNFVFRSG